MVREKEGRILWIESPCYLKIGFESDNGEAIVKMIRSDTLTEFIDESFDLSEQCVNIKQEHRKVDDIRAIDKCRIKRKALKGIDEF